MIKNIINFFLFLIVATLMVILMQFSLRFLKDNLSNKKVDPGEYILTRLNRLEKEQLLFEKNALLSMLDDLMRQKINIDPSDKSKIKEITQKIDQINQKLETTSRKLEKNLQEEKILISSAKDQTEGQSKPQMNFIEQIIKKDQENIALKVKAENYEKELKKREEMKEEEKEILKARLLQIYKNNPKMVQAIETSFKKNQEINILLEELSKIDKLVNVSPESIKEVQKIFPEVFKEANIVSQTNLQQENVDEEFLKSLIKEMEVLILDSYNYKSIRNEYAVFKNEYLKTNNINIYFRRLVELISKGNNLLKTDINEKDQKISNHSQTIIKLLLMIEQQRQQLSGK